ncbi:MAG TPA: class IV adenylate cyclase [Candidatus Acidoferrales bacterium]
MRQIKKTPTEIEVKLRVHDLADILTRLTRFGATTHGRVLEQNTLFDTPDSAFRKTGRLLRVRTETPAAPSRPAGKARAILTAKAPPPKRNRTPSRYKERSESELTIRDPHQFAKSLNNLGFRPAFRYEKFRTTFTRGPLHLDLDETPVGTILELEGPPAAIDAAAKALGFTQKDYLRATYWDLYAADCRRRNVTPKHMLFPARKSR